LNDNSVSQAQGASGTSTQGEERQDSANGTPERRERRSRDRYGRDRRERNNSNEGNTSENLPTETGSQDHQAQEEAPAARSYFDRAQSTSAPMDSTAQATPVAVSVAATHVASTPTQTAAPAVGLPKVQAYELPMASLMQVAEGSGLQWVNSDPEKIAQVQAAIAAEPKPVHVPRVRPPAVVLDEGPLVLVETRKDLSDMKLPF
jgi:ribonuclease E